MKNPVKKFAKTYQRMFEVMNYMTRTEIAAWGNTLWNKQIHGFGSRDFVFISKHNKIQAYMDVADLPKTAVAGLKNLTNAKFTKHDLKVTWGVLETMNEEIRNLQKSKIDVLTNKALGFLAKRYFATLINVYGRFQTSVNWYTIEVENLIRDYLAKTISDSLACEDILRKLVRPIRRFEFEAEEIELLKIAKQFKKYGNRLKQQIGNQAAVFKLSNFFKKHYPKLYGRVLRHQQIYEWLNADSNLLSYTLEDCLKKITDIMDMPTVDIEKKLNEVKNRQRQVISENKVLIKRYKINPYFQKLIFIFQEYAYIRFCIRFRWTQGLFYVQKIHLEVAKRAGLTVEDVRYCLTTEIVDYLLRGKKLDKIDLRRRRNLYVVWLKDFKFYLFTGKQADQISKRVWQRAKVEQTSEIKGDIGSPGRATGKVKVISYDKPLTPQITAMAKGDILVAGQTRPEIITACRKAGAIVTNEGGICSHAAVVAREFNIPCIIGTKIATDIFKDGDLVEVDANQGIVRKI